MQGEGFARCTLLLADTMKHIATAVATKPAVPTAQVAW